MQMNSATRYIGVSSSEFNVVYLQKSMYQLGALQHLVLGALQHPLLALKPPHVYPTPYPAPCPAPPPNQPLPTPIATLPDPASSGLAIGMIVGPLASGAHMRPLATCASSPAIQNSGTSFAMPGWDLMTADHEIHHYKPPDGCQ